MTGQDISEIKPQEEFDLPSRYHVDQIIVMPRDPWWLTAYWELLPSTLEQGRKKLNEEEVQLILRVYENGTIHRCDVSVSDSISDWTLEVIPDRAWGVEIGLRSSTGQFLPLVRSNRTRTPPDRPSHGLDLMAWRGVSS